MNELPERAEKSGKKHPSVGSALCGLSDYTVKGDYDLTVQLYSDKSCSTPECTHHIKGSMKHEVRKLLAMGGLAVILAAICAGTVCVCKNLMCD